MEKDISEVSSESLSSGNFSGAVLGDDCWTWVEVNIRKCESSCCLGGASRNSYTKELFSGEIASDCFSRWIEGDAVFDCVFDISCDARGSSHDFNARSRSIKTEIQVRIVFAVSSWLDDELAESLIGNEESCRWSFSGSESLTIRVSCLILLLLSVCLLNDISD